MKSPTTLKYFLLIAAITGIFCQCKRDKDINCPEGHIQVGEECIQEQELITTLKLHFVRAPKDTITYAFKDTDGPGGNAPTIDTIKLDTNSSYTVLLEVLDESKTPAENITEEIEEESDEHQFFYNPGQDLNLTVTYNDQDVNGLPIGLNTTHAPGAASTGTLNVVLKHQPGGIKDNNQATGDTDIEVDFPVVIK